MDSSDVCVTDEGILRNFVIAHGTALHRVVGYATVDRTSPTLPDLAGVVCTTEGGRMAIKVIGVGGDHER